MFRARGGAHRGRARLGGCVEARLLRLGEQGAGRPSGRGAQAVPAWLDQAHRQLDAAVAAAYGWDDYQPAMPDAEILRRLLALNRQLANGFEGDSRD